MFQPRRPKPGEDEADILAQEKEFLASLQSSAAQGQQGGVVGRRPPFEPAAKVVKQQQKKDGHHHHPSRPLQGQPVNINKDKDIIAAGVEEEPSEIVIQENITERSFDVSKLMAFPQPQPALPKVQTGGRKSMFAKGLVLPNSSSKQRKAGKSLFAQMFDAQNQQSSSSNPPTADNVTSLVAENTINSLDSGIFCVKDGKPVIGDKIHPYLAGMTQAEIMQEQQKLVERLDPRLVEFIRSRQNKKQLLVNVDDTMRPAYELGTNRPIKDRDVDMTRVPSSENKTDSINYSCSVDEAELPIDPKTVQNIPGMGKLESEKLEWTGVVKENRKTFDKLEDGESARFDFDGLLLTGQEFNSKETFDKGLHHHGQEMEKPGYTLEELLTLARSANNQQKARALQIIGNIYVKAHTGMYDFVLEKSLFELWEYMDFVYAIRKGLDEGDKTLINESIHCLASIMYPWEEELCLDIVHGWEYSKPYPWISTKSENLIATLDPGEKETELKDEEMLKMDFIEFFVHRSNLLDRLCYFLKGDCLTEVGVDGILKILIRVARHSPNALVDHALLSIIVKNYTNPNWNQASIGHVPNLQGVPLWMAFKVLRILIDSNPRNASKIYENYKIFPSVMSYLAFDDWKSNSFVQRPEYIVIESFRIWIALVSHGLAIDEYTSFFPVLMKFFVLYQSMDELSPFDLLHSGYVISLLLAIMKMRDNVIHTEHNNKHSHWALVKDCVWCVEKISIKLMTIISSPHLDSTYDEGALFWSLSRALEFLTESAKYDRQCITERLISVLNKFISSKLYGNITSQLQKHSVILASQDTSSRYPNNFASVNALFFGGNCNPIIVFGNALPLLSAIFGMQKCIGEDGVPNTHIIIDRNVNDYVKALLNSTQSQLPPSFFVRYELTFIQRLLKLYPLNSNDRFNLAYRAISETPKCCARLFNNLFKIALSSSCDKNEMDSCYKIYGGYLLLDEAPISPPARIEKEEENDDIDVPKKKVKFSNEAKTIDGPGGVGKLSDLSSILFQKWSERAIESHWILEPMHRIRLIVGSAPGFLSKNLDEIELQCKICLQLISKCLEQHCDFVIQTPKDILDVYCAVCQVFLLGDPRIYLGDTSLALTRILNSLLNSDVFKKFSNKRIFSRHKQTPGLPNMFLDFYPDLVKEYSENSYFNEIFANYLMLPLRIPEDARLKSNFWIMETIQYLKIKSTQALIPLDYLTTGTENDSALLDIYLKLLRSRKITRENNEFLFNVIKTNLQNAISGDKDSNLLHLGESFHNLQV